MNKQEKLARLDFEEYRTRIFFGVVLLVTLFLSLSQIVTSNCLLSEYYVQVLGGFLVFVVAAMLVVFHRYKVKYKALKDIINKEV